MILLSKEKISRICHFVRLYTSCFNEAEKKKKFRKLTVLVDKTLKCYDKVGVEVDG